MRGRAHGRREDGAGCGHADDAASAACLGGTYDFNSQFSVTTDLHVRYYRQPKGGPLIAESKLVHSGRRLLSTECSVTDAEGRVLIRTTATFMLIPNPKPV
ncbi:PaaI family thioesterase [Mycolicibacterium sp. 120270]|uniref:PaaI family thioesterase n=1 Tax=Mycolicibacterium sp. 120270 TaxID=3090600 RepID=UPI0039B0865F